MQNIDIIVGVRPDFIQAAALNLAIQDSDNPTEFRFVHTGQHYDAELSHTLLEQLNFTTISIFLEIDRIEGVGKLASIMTAYENQILLDRPDLVVVIGNSDSALGCALVAARNRIRIAHIDGGVRCHDLSLAEEQNDVMIDRLSSILFTSNEESVINLIREGFDNSQILEVGNLRADAVFQNLGYAEDSTILSRYGLEQGSYIVVTLHHDHILSNRDFLTAFFMMLEQLSEGLRIYVVLHPKSLLLLEETPEILLDTTENLQIISSQDYHDMLKLTKNAALVVTDSQGLQEETTILGVQCLTLGHTSNRPITLSRGTNTLIGYDVDVLRDKIVSIIDGDRVDGFPIDNWEGKAGQRIAKILSELS